MGSHKIVKELTTKEIILQFQRAAGTVGCAMCVLLPTRWYLGTTKMVYCDVAYGDQPPLHGSEYRFGLLLAQTSVLLPKQAYSPVN